MTEFFSGAGQFILVSGIAFLVLCAITSFLRFQGMAQRAVAAAAAMEPEDAFHARLAHQLGTVHRAPAPFCVMLLAPEGHAEILGPVREEVLQCLEQRARRSVRPTDYVGRYGTEQVGLIVAAPRAAAGPIADRLIRSVHAEPCSCASGPAVRVRAKVGISSHPENGDRVGTLLDEAAAALAAADPAESSAWKLAGAAAGAEAAPAAPPVSPPPRDMVDEVTGVIREQRVGSALQKYAARYRKKGEPVSVLLIDIDHFDRYLEHYGPDAGDTILRRLSEVLQAGVREDDLIGRVGREEFVIAMGCAPRNALIAGQRLVGLVKRTAFPMGRSHLRITVSIGVAGYPDHGGDPRRLVEAADVALETAKDSGRNMCLLFEPAMRTTGQKAPGAGDRF